MSTKPSQNIKRPLILGVALIVLVALTPLAVKTLILTSASPITPTASAYFNLGGDGPITAW